MIVPTKTDMYELYQKGCFGNKLRTWSLEEYLNNDFTGTVVLRYAGTGGGGKAAYHLSRNEVPNVVAEWESEGLSRSRIKVNESAPDSLLTVQGEVMRSEEGLSLRYSRMKAPMRKALAEQPEHARGLSAVLLLRHTLNPSSFEDIMELLDLYDGAVVEFSAFSVNLGDCRGRNALVWEVRHY